MLDCTGLYLPRIHQHTRTGTCAVRLNTVESGYSYFSLCTLKCTVYLLHSASTPRSLPFPPRSTRTTHSPLLSFRLMFFSPPAQCSHAIFPPHQTGSIHSPIPQFLIADWFPLFPLLSPSPSLCFHKNRRVERSPSTLQADADLIWSGLVSFDPMTTSFLSLLSLFPFRR